MPRRCLALLLIATTLTGCPGTAPPKPPEDTPAPIGIAFDPDNVGTITGQVKWSGELPDVPPHLAPPNPLNSQGAAKRAWPNPNLPHVDPRTGGVRDAVVCLRGVDLTRARPWDHPAVHVEFRPDELVVVQGDYVGRRGFVRRGDRIEVVSKQAVFHSLQVRGAAFFTLTLPNVDQPRSRQLDRNGIVELSSGVGRFWMRGHLFVDDHPYYVRTDAEGRFTLRDVPPGQYQLVCWHPNWHEDVREHDADTFYISRLTFRPSVEIVQDVEVRRHETRQTTFTLTQKQFER